MNTTATVKTLGHYNNSNSMPDVIEITRKEEKTIVAEFFGISSEQLGMILNQMGFNKNKKFPWLVDTNEIAKSLLLLPKPTTREGIIRRIRQRPCKRRQPHNFRA